MGRRKATTYSLGTYKWDGRRETARQAAIDKWKALKDAITSDDEHPCPLCVLKPDEGCDDCALQKAGHHSKTDNCISEWGDVGYAIDQMLEALDKVKTEDIQDE